MDYAPAFFVVLSKAAHPRYISNGTLETYYKDRGNQIVFLIFTCYGLLTSEEILSFNLRLGGIALCKFM